MLVLNENLDIAGEAQSMIESISGLVTKRPRVSGASVRHTARESSMGYVAVIIASLIVTVFGFSLEITAGNIGHVRHGREPNAGAAIFPSIPSIPAFAVGLSWLLNRWYMNLGTWTVIGVCFISVCCCAVSQRRLNAELRTVMEESNHPPRA